MLLAKKFPVVCAGRSVHFRIHNIRPHVPIFSEINDFYAVPFSLRTVLILSRLRSDLPSGLFPTAFITHLTVSISVFPHTRHIPLPSQYFPFCDSNNTYYFLTYLLTYLLSYLITYSPIHSFNYLLTYLFTYLLTRSLSHSITYILTYSLHTAQSFLRN